MAFGRRKYGNKRFEVNGVKFDSKLEYTLHTKLNLIKANFEFQKNIELVEGYVLNGKKIRPIGMRVDFVVYAGEETIYADTKGFATPEAKIKYKMLGFKIKDEKGHSISWLKNEKEVNQFINLIITKNGIN